MSQSNARPRDEHGRFKPGRNPYPTKHEARRELAREKRLAHEYAERCARATDDVTRRELAHSATYHATLADIWSQISRGERRIPPQGWSR